MKIPLSPPRYLKISYYHIGAIISTNNLSIVAVTLSDFIIFSTNSAGNALLSWGHARLISYLYRKDFLTFYLLLYMYFQIPFFPFYIPFISPHPLRPLFVTYTSVLSIAIWYIHLQVMLLSSASFILIFSLFILLCLLCCVIWYGRYFSFSMSPYVIPSLFVYTEDEKVYLGISK